MKVSLIDKYSVDELRFIVESCDCLADVISAIGYKSRNGHNSMTVLQRLKKYGISTAHFKIGKPNRELTDSDVFCLNSDVRQCTLRKWFSKCSDTSVCSICGHPRMWNNKPLTMILDHINGNNKDNRKENLRWICPNCNSQLDTFAGRNKKESCKEKRIRLELCPVCHKNYMSLGADACKECSLSQRRIRPSEEELRSALETLSINGVARKYSVSWNAVKKWIRFYGINLATKC